MNFRVILSSDVAKTIRSLSPLLKRQIRGALDILSENPHIGKALKDELSGFFSYRVSRYRIVYRIKSQQIQVQVIDVGQRSNIYQRVKKRIEGN
jgi:mRNA interferase RelE/StbE